VSNLKIVIRTPVVVLYSRPGCHLCDEAREGLAGMRAGGAHFELREVDIDADDGLLRTHLERIPVVEVDGTEVCELGLDAGAVRARLDTVSA
ncbi:MAG: glutaredoxin family protein, partial [Solirubrobacterales bacterium]